MNGLEDFAYQGGDVPFIDTDFVNGGVDYIVNVYCINYCYEILFEALVPL